jgi:L-2-hydroxyglutarate oxidase
MKYDLVVVGAGIVGLATAYRWMQQHPDARILVLEKENRVAPHQTGNNSGVIHSGIYYKPGSYKAKNSVEGRHQLVEFCREHAIKHDICGKLIVALNDAEIPRLEGIYQRGLQNGIEDMKLIGRSEMLEIEPHVAGVKAIHVGCTGIVDFVGVCETLKKLLEQNGNEVRFNTKVTGISGKPGAKTVETTQGTFETALVITCGGLQADLLARSAGVDPEVQIVPFRGEYFMLKKDAEHLVRHLIYPLPNPEFPFLGVHFTRLALGGIECGPNAVFAFKREGYTRTGVSLRDTIETLSFSGFWKMAAKHWRMGLDEYHRSFSKAAFTKGLQTLVPEIREEHLEEAPAGVRAMALSPKGEILDDFYFVSGTGDVHVMNAPSPAATSALSLANEIVRFTKVRLGLK